MLAGSGLWLAGRTETRLADVHKELATLQYADAQSVGAAVERSQSLALERRVPMLGVCLGIQLLAKAEGAAVYPLAGGPEIGWFPVELTATAADDPLFARLPARFDAFGWHYYTYDLPERAEELGRSTRCNQAFRLGENAWGVQFHPEVTLEIVESWLADEDDFPADLDRAELEAATRRGIGAWNDLGRALCGGFLDLAERLAGSPREPRAQLAELGS